MNVIIPTLRKNGVATEALTKILIDNPQRVLALDVKSLA